MANNKLQVWSSAELPDDVVPAPTYAMFRELIGKWADGRFKGTMIVVGSAGVGKSESALRALDKHFSSSIDAIYSEQADLNERDEDDGEEDGDRGFVENVGPYAYVKGKASTFGVYGKLYAYRDKPIVLDDVDSMLADKAVTDILKALLETRPNKIIQWTSGKTMGKKSNLPSSFSTQSRTLVLANELKSLSKNFEAVLDRATIVWFCPPSEEVHKYVGTWFDVKADKDVYDYVGSRLHLSASPSCRLYVKAQQWKHAELGWRDMVDQILRPQGADDHAAIMALLLADKSFADDKSRVIEWRRQTGYGQVHYYATKKSVNLARGIQSEKSKQVSGGMKKKHAERRENGEADATAKARAAKIAKPKGK